ncbi:MAG: class I SAM-dependent methyltransferase [archaeon]
MKELYEKEYFSMYSNDPKRDRMYILERDRILKYKKKGKILDIGCGLGLFLKNFDDKKWDKYGVEISEYASGIARKNNIKLNKFEKAYDFPDNSFDVIVFRGTIQHLDTPFLVIKKCYDLLKKDGLIVFISTPNANSIYYKLFNTLPMLDPTRNFYIPSDITLRDTLQNFGFEVVEIRYPYLDTPYANPIKDHMYFVLSLIGFKKKFAFLGNMMECYGRKC